MTWKIFNLPQPKSSSNSEFRQLFASKCRKIIEKLTLGRSFQLFFFVNYSELLSLISLMFSLMCQPTKVTSPPADQRRVKTNRKKKKKKLTDLTKLPMRARMMMAVTTRGLRQRQKIPQTPRQTPLRKLTQAVIR